jgi:hypothetical protein
MFTQRKTDSYGLVGTNGRNSDDLINQAEEAMNYGQ